MKTGRALTVVSWVARVVASVILLQTLFFKFTGAEESVFIFEQLGAEPWGRYLSGVAELIAAALLLTPKLGWAGGLVGSVVMLGAIGSHLTKLGIVVQEDGGSLFGMAVVVLVSCVVVLFVERGRVPWVGGGPVEAA